MPTTPSFSRVTVSSSLFLTGSIRLVKVLQNSARGIFGQMESAVATGTGDSRAAERRGYGEENERLRHMRCGLFVFQRTPIITGGGTVNYA